MFSLKVDFLFCVKLLLLKFKTSIVSQFRNTEHYFPWSVRSLIKSWLWRYFPLVDKKIFPLQCFSDPFQIWTGFREEHVFKKAGSRSWAVPSDRGDQDEEGDLRDFRSGATGHSQSVGSESRWSQCAHGCSCHGDSQDSQKRAARGTDAIGQERFQ